MLLVAEARSYSELLYIGLLPLVHLSTDYTCIIMSLSVGLHIVLSFLVATAVRQASACSCVPPYPSVCNSHYGVRARILDKTGNASNHESIQYRARIEDVLRDRTSSVQRGDTVAISTESHTCGFPDLLVGETYIIGGEPMSTPESVCPSGMTYQDCGSGCGPATCARPNSTTCLAVCRPGCYCKDGLVKEVSGGSRCIRVEDCPGHSTTISSLYCPGGMIYNECGSGCGPATCASPEISDTTVCPDVCIPGCSCDGGLVKETMGGSRCIRREECSGSIGAYSIFRCSVAVISPDDSWQFSSHGLDENGRCSGHTSTASTTLLVFSFIVVAMVMSWGR